MENADMLLVRDHSSPHAFNLAIGEPFFLHEHLHFLEATATGGPYLYPQSRGEPELLKELERRHHGMHVVVTVGAKQGISAALAAYAEVYGTEAAIHTAPYWPSYPILAKREFPIYGLGSMASYMGGPNKVVRVTTSPNNPDGTESTEDCDIWDAAYASSVYGFTTPPAHWTVAVYSAAKLLGLSGLRIGWVVTADARLAKAIAVYVERFTSGVCVTSQRHLAYALKHLRVNDDHAFFDAARKTLLKNGETFMKLLGDRLSRVDGVPTSGKGMFAWFHVPGDSLQSFKDALTTSKVLLMPGEAFGMVEPGWYRMSMGHHDGYTYRALKALAEAWV
jgi:aspartate/methionine/tyrosine aminotransferase